MRKLLSIVLLCAGFVSAQYPLTWQWTGRVHSELDWKTIETEHYRVHYHQGLDSIAVSGASIAELTHETLLEQVGLDTIPVIDIIFTTEDEIMNGFATHMNNTFIWVDQNDVAIWLEDKKWLCQVLTHELQHIVFFNVIKTWVPEPWSRIFSGTPGWFVEGLAEYMTERWRPHRADLSHKSHILRNEVDRMDAHHDGFSKVKYWTDRFGDSTIVKMLHYRNKMKMFNFKEAFKKATGITVKQFNEDWRRNMNTYYYGHRAQKEAIEDIGETMTLPINKVNSFLFSSDSTKMAITGRKNNDQWDRSLYIVQRDTVKEREILENREKETPAADFFSKLFSSKSDTSDSSKKEKDPVIWKTDEMDFGQFHSRMSWSPDNKQLVYAKYHYGKHQSMVWDLCKLDTENEEITWLTKSLRASHPNWSPNGNEILFVAHQNNTSNLYVISPDGGEPTQVTNYTGDIQLLNPTWSPDGTKIAFAKSDPDGNTDIYIRTYVEGEEMRVTDNPEVDYLPIWHPDGKSITFTSHKGSTPNLHTINLETFESIQNTDVGDAVWGAQWTPNDSTILATTLGDVDTVRIVKVNPKRVATTSETLVMRDVYTRWRSKSPLQLLPEYDPLVVTEYTKPVSYKFWKHPKHLVSFVLPYETGVFGLTAWTDPIGRHIIEVAGVYDWNQNESAWNFSYINAQHGPLWSLSINHNFAWDIRGYGNKDQWLLEAFDGATLATQIPFNFGKNMSSSHLLLASLSLRERRAILLKEENNATFIDPEDGKESLIMIGHQWTNRRPYRMNAGIPQKGCGVRSTLQIADERLYGDFSWQRFVVDIFGNIKAGPTVFFFRSKSELLEGKNPPNQEYAGLTNARSLYLPGTSGTGGFTENLNPRGWNEIRTGNRVTMNTFELRLPIASKLPINVLFFGIGSVSAAVFSDVGNAWTTGNGMDEWIATAGYEAKFGLNIAGDSILIFSAGQAQTFDRWQDKEKPEDYFRLALINPF